MRNLVLALLLVPTLAWADGDKAPEPTPAPAPTPKILELPAPPTLAIGGSGRECSPNALGQTECKAPPKQSTPSTK
jgi:hypothetical protein